MSAAADDDDDEVRRGPEARVPPIGMPLSSSSTSVRWAVVYTPRREARPLNTSQLSSSVTGVQWAVIYTPRPGTTPPNTSRRSVATNDVIVPPDNDTPVDREP